jgi:hypothetical protein
VEVAVRKWLRMQERDFFQAGLSKLVPTWGKCILCSEIAMKNIHTAVEQMSQIECCNDLSFNCYDL